ncbi:MAG: T9SS type A sorting domain-containing protein [Bacteroidetes bacterium]|nr:T9SS type A sorting domain-containing protein [Bacteroidota bacterium]MBL7103584.1 T9SS type A sorting domain-containing protein [Bacteroidales bacterium]
MKKNYKISAGLILILQVQLLSAQMFVNQIIIGNGGIYGNPSDHVTIATYDPESQITVTFGDVIRESIQDLIVYENFAYVTAEDSIVKFNIDTYEKAAAVYESNLHKLFYKSGLLYVSRRADINGAPADGIYLKVFNAEDLSLVASVEGISADAAGIMVECDTIYVAIYGEWTATEGKFAVIDNNFNLVREMNFGTDAVGIYDLYSDGSKIYSVNKSPYMAQTGSVTTYEIFTASYSTSIINHIVGKGAGISNNTLYLGLDYGIGSYDITTNQVIQQTIVPDPGSGNYIYIADAAFDEINNLFYVTITDYFSMGEGKIYNLSGNQTGIFEAGISAEAIDIDYRMNSFIREENNYVQVHLYPNPTIGFIHIQNEDITEVKVSDVSGKVVLKKNFDNQNNITIDLSGFPAGVYIININLRNNNYFCERIIKH